ncbi:MAG: transposase [Vulcanibacillus sp.]
MSRKPRIEFEGALYHVIQRGNNKEYIFKRNDYKKYFLSKLKEFKDIMNFEVYGYVVMDNHYHLVIRTREAYMSSIMHRVNNDFSKYYNISNKRTGHVFQERYKGILVKDDKYLLSLLQYVHQNPVKANMCKRVSDYKWSSDFNYRKNLQGQLVDIDFVLNIFSLNRKTAIEEYIKFMDSSELEESSGFEDIQVIGEYKASNLQIKMEKQSLDDILYEAVDNNEVLFKLIKNGSRKRSLTEYKILYIRKSISENYTMDEIGKNIGISDSAICLLANKE